MTNHAAPCSQIALYYSQVAITITKKLQLTDRNIILGSDSEMIANPDFEHIKRTALDLEEGTNSRDFDCNFISLLRT